VIIIKKEDVKIDFYEQRGDIIIHRQLERKDGFCYMRLKRRKIVKA